EGKLRTSVTRSTPRSRAFSSLISSSETSSSSAERSSPSAMFSSAAESLSTPSAGRSLSKKIFMISLFVLLFRNRLPRAVETDRGVFHAVVMHARERLDERLLDDGKLAHG